MKRSGIEKLSLPVGCNAGVAIVSSDNLTESFGTWTIGVAWSTIKTALAVAALRSGIALEAEVITESNNAAAERLWSQLGKPSVAADRVRTVLREAGDDATVVETRRRRAEYTPFGQTQWSLTNQARFAAGLPGVAGARRVVDLMGELVAEHRWGLAGKGFAAKGGWGPGLDGRYLVRQFGVREIGARTVGVALAADIRDGDYETGVGVIDTLAEQTVSRLSHQ